MKKFLKITSIIIVIIFGLLLTLPILFKGKILKKVQTEMDKSLNAKVSIGDLKLSFIKGFPNVYVALENFTIAGKGEFDKDTLITFKEFSVKVDLVSAIKGGPYNIKSVLLDQPKISVIVLKNGKANWDITKPDTVKVKIDTTKSAPMKYSIKLKKFEIRNAIISYNDDLMKAYATLKGFNFILKGDMTQDMTSLDIKSTINALTAKYDGIKYLNDVGLKMTVVLDADLKNSVYTIKENEIALNQLVLFVTGSIKMPKDAMVFDMKYGLKKAEFKSILSLVPSVYMKGYESLRASGNIKLDGFLKGTMAGKIMPSAGINLEIDNAMFKYPDLPKSVSNVNVSLKVFYDGAKPDNTTIDLNKFHMEMAANPFDMTVHVKTPMSDMQVSGNFKGKVDITSIADVIPLDSMTIKGIMDANIEFGGKMSSIQKQKYEEFKANGTLNLTAFEFKSSSFQQGIRIPKAGMSFSPKFVELTAFDCGMGKSDFHLTGKIEKFIPYMFKGDTIIGSLAFNSTLLDLNEFMSGNDNKETKKTTVDTVPMNTMEVPGNVDFKLTSNLKKINYDKMVISNTVGVIVIKNSKVAMQNVNMDMLDGSMKIDGEYNTQNMKKPSVDFNLDIKDFDIPSTFKAFSSMAKLAPIAKDCKGKVSIKMKYAGLLDQHMGPQLNTVNGGGGLQSKSIQITNSATFSKIGDLIKNDKYKNPTLTNVDIKFTIKDGRIYVSPFETSIGKSKWTIGGDQGLDQTLHYNVKVAMPRSELGSGVNQTVEGLLNTGILKKANIKAPENINLNFLVKGTVANPEVKPVFGGGSGDDSKGEKDQAKNEVKQEVKDNVKQKVNDQLVPNAKIEAQKLRDGAKVTADKVRKEANDRATQLEQSASNPFAKIAAKKTADQIRKEGDKKANAIIAEADTKANAMVAKAQAEADKK